jgi:hypothetical protein
MVINGGVSIGSRQISGAVGRAENIYVKEVNFSNRFELPSIGRENIIYAVKDEHKLYIFNPITNNYEVIGSDYREIEIIQGIL